MNNNEPICPKCNSPIVLKKGKYGRFLSCSNYPYCAFSDKPNIKQLLYFLIRTIGLKDYNFAEELSIDILEHNRSTDAFIAKVYCQHYIQTLGIFR